MTEITEAEFLLRIDEIALFNKLGIWRFQMDQYGYYDPNKILKMDLEQLGRDTYDLYFLQFKEKVCEFWINFKNSELFDDSKDVYFFIIGILFASNVPYYAATFIAAILIKRSLNALCGK